MVMFFVPVTGLAMASVDHDEQANAAGLSNFMRTLAGAFATSLIQSRWSDATRHNEGEIVNAMQHGKAGGRRDDSRRASRSTTRRALLWQVVEGQSVMLATLNMFGVIAALPRLRGDDHLAGAQAQGPDRHQRRALVAVPTLHSTLAPGRHWLRASARCFPRRRRISVARAKMREERRSQMTAWRTLSPDQIRGPGGQAGPVFSPQFRRRSRAP